MRQPLEDSGFFFQLFNWPPICCDFFKTVLFLEKSLLKTFSEKLIRHNSYFFGTAISSEQLLLFEELLFQSSQRSSFFRAELLPSSHFLRTESSLGQLFLGTATFSTADLFITKIATEELLFRSSYFCTASTFSEKLHFGKS